MNQHELEIRTITFGARLKIIFIQHPLSEGYCLLAFEGTSTDVSDKPATLIFRALPKCLYLPD